MWKPALVALVLIGCVLVALRFSLGSGPYAGTWKLTVLQPGAERTLCLLRVGGDEAHPTAKVLDAPSFAGAEAENVRVEDGALRFELRTERATYPVIARAPKGEAVPKRLLGSFRDRGAYEMLRLERTEVQELDSKKLTVKPQGLAALSMAVEAPDLKAKEDSIREVL